MSDHFLFISEKSNEYTQEIMNLLGSEEELPKEETGQNVENHLSITGNLTETNTMA